MNKVSMHLSNYVEHSPFNVIRLYQKINQYQYLQTSNISDTLLGNKLVDDSDVVGTAPSTSSFWT